MFAATATALVAYKLNRPCRMAMRMPDIMKITGKRPDTRLDYEVGVDGNGQIQYMEATFYINDGMSSNENENSYATKSLKNCYNPDRWKVASFGVITDAPTNCFMRAPGEFEGISAIEHVMEHIADELKKDPIEVRFANYRINDNQLPDYIPMFLEKSDYNKRLEYIKEFNAKNRWKKRGLRLNNMAFDTTYFGNYSAVVSVYHGDGSVVINAGGVEIGQGINTKLAQAAAFEFKIPVEKVAVIASYDFATPNCYSTASSITTECVALCVIRSCEQINARLAPVRAAMPNATWEEVVLEADVRGILLQANAETSPNDPRLQNYSIFGVAAAEVEVDLLTGTKYIVRGDIFEDVGVSINPALDVGQVEGAFVQGLSLWLIEDVIYNRHNGEIYTDRTWNYHIIGATDIPNDYRVYFSRNRPNPVGILGSKATGEPATCLSRCVVDSMREAIQASRQDSGYNTDNFLNVVPLVTQVTQQQFVIYRTSLEFVLL
ncbi:xanthine dehydrogenase-like [Cydia strobilella]|uniref:xanthine dehydrogenase-like n=1 Tax=Cydia strobilella TaxID=1100964 RepID=UPI003004F13E